MFWHSILYGAHDNSVAMGNTEYFLQDAWRPCVGFAGETNTWSENTEQQTLTDKVQLP
jgi:hypothetical protein